MISELSIRFKNIRGDDKKGFPVISGLKYHEDGYIRRRNTKHPDGAECAEYFGFCKLSNPALTTILARK